MSQGAKYAVVAGLAAWTLPLGMILGRYLGRRNNRANDYAFGVR